MIILSAYCFSGGLSNWIYLCSLPQGLNKNVREENADEPRSVLLRLFGQKIPSEAAACEAAFNELVNAQITDNVIFTLLSGSTLDLSKFNVNVMTGNNEAYQRSPYDPVIQK